MRDDLLHADASVSWAVAQLPSFTVRIERWLTDNVEVVIEEQPPPATHDTIVAIKKAALPLTFNVEFGAYINAIRSSLDILATSLNNRYSVGKPEDAYFPIARSADAFAAGRYRASKLVKGLPDRERSIIEELQPYRGGNDLFVRLNDLDVLRKHRRLIEVDVIPHNLFIPHDGPIGDVFEGDVIFPGRRENKTVLGRIRKDAAGRKFKFTPKISLTERAPSRNTQVIEVVNEFASLANSIINLFDTP